MARLLQSGTDYLLSVGVTEHRAPQTLMSIYKPAFERAVSDNDVTHTVRPRAAVKAFHAPGNAAAPEVVRLRKAKPIEYLLPTTTKWLNSLPNKCGQLRSQPDTHESPTSWRWTGIGQQLAAGISMISYSMITVETGEDSQWTCTGSWRRCVPILIPSI